MTEIGNRQSTFGNEFCLLPGCGRRAVSTAQLCGRHQNAFNNPGRADWPIVAAAVGGAGQAQAARAAVEARARAMPLDPPRRAETEPAGSAGNGKDAAMTTTSKTSKKVCLVPGCDRPAKNRGVCGACYIHWVNRRDNPTDRTRAIVAVMLPPGPHGGHRRGKGAKAGKAAAARPAPQVCLVPGCDRPAKTRGVCKPCYVYAAKHGNNPTDRSRAIKAAMLAPTRGGKRRAGAGKGPLRRVSGKEPVHLPPLTDEQRHAPRSMGVSDDPLMTAATVEAAEIIALLEIFGVDLVEFATPGGHRFINADNGREVLLEAESGMLVPLDVQPAT